MCCFFFFFFQAEDGIRDLVRSRGLGDVYKRQSFILIGPDDLVSVGRDGGADRYAPFVRLERRVADEPVSYTHLTLPTSDLV